MSCYTFSLFRKRHNLYYGQGNQLYAVFVNAVIPSDSHSVVDLDFFDHFYLDWGNVYYCVTANVTNRHLIEYIH